jgi:hypothetical protein
LRYERKFIPGIIFAILLISNWSVLAIPVSPLLLKNNVQPEPEPERSVNVSHVSSVPVINGSLDDKEWALATVIKDFWVASQQKAPSEKTEVLILADNDTLYIAFRCYDSQVNNIVAYQATRDGSHGYDDHVTVQLDTYHNHRSISEYSVNAIGTQSDVIAGGRARKIEWKGDWHAAVSRTDYGWSAEMAIPFEILNYRNSDTIFGVNFLRYHNRTLEHSRWAAITPQQRPEEMGHLTGLVLPESVKQHPWSAMPYLLVGHNVPDSAGIQQEKLATAGVDIRYEPKSNLTGVLSLNPDFSQLERQVTDIDFSYTEKSVSDQRPFFQEGSAYFNSGKQYFYSNRIPDFDIGAKTFSQSGSNQLGVLFTKADDERWDGVVRVGRELDASHGIDVMFVSTRRMELDNDLAVINLNGREESGFSYDLDVAHTKLITPGIDEGKAQQGSISWRGDYWTIGSLLDNYDRKFFPANGIIEEDIIGTRGANAYISYYRDSAAGQFRAVTGNLSRSIRYTDDGRSQRRNWYIDGTLETHQQIRLGLYYFSGEYRPLLGSERGIYGDTVNEDYYTTTSLDFNTRSSVHGYGIAHSWGLLGDEDYKYTTLYAWAKPSIRTYINLTTEKLEYFSIFEQAILSAGWDITNEQGIVGRYIYFDDSNAFRLAYRRKVRSGMDAFAVYDRNPSEPVKVSIKLVWTIQ